MGKLYIDIEVPDGVDVADFGDIISSHLSKVSQVAKLLGGKAFAVSHISKVPSIAAAAHLKKLASGEEAA